MLDTLSDTAAAFSKTLEAVAVGVEGDIEKLVRGVVLKVFRRIIERSPFETGRYKANHGISIEEPGHEALIEDFEGATEGQIENFKWKISDGQIWFYNNLEYAEALENGHSDDAPKGVYAVTLTEFDYHFADELSNYEWFD